MNKVSIISIVLVTLSLVPLLMSLIKMRMLKNFREKGISTTATVTDVEVRYRPKGGYYYWLSFVYKTIPGGQAFTGRAVVYKRRNPGETIPLVYMPDKPTKFSIDMGKRLPYLAAFSVVFFLLIVWFCYWLNSQAYTTT